MRAYDTRDFETARTLVEKSFEAALKYLNHCGDNQIFYSPESRVEFITSFASICMETMHMLRASEENEEPWR